MLLSKCFSLAHLSNKNYHSMRHSIDRALTVGIRFSAVSNVTRFSRCCWFICWRSKSDWNRAISDAEKLLGNPNIFLPLQALPSDGVVSMVGGMRKLIGTNHPLLKITKRLIYNGRKNMQTRGLIMLLMAKLVTGQSRPPNAWAHNTDQTLEEIAANQRHLATITELVYTAHLIHKGVVNVSELIYTDGLFLEDLEFGNKIAILLGDYFLANANLLLGSLKNTEVVYMISGCIRNFVEGEFVFDQDVRGNAVPSLATTMEDWEVKTYFSSASLLANSCKSIMILAKLDEVSQTRAFEFGKLLGLAWQICSDVQHFVDEKRHPIGSPFDLISAPIVLHLQRDPTMIDCVKPLCNTSDQIDYKKIRALVNAGNAVSDAIDICQNYVQNAVHLLHCFPASDTRTALVNIVRALRV